MNPLYKAVLDSTYLDVQTQVNTEFIQRMEKVLKEQDEAKKMSKALDIRFGPVTARILPDGTKVPVQRHEHSDVEGIQTSIKGEGVL